MAVVGIINLLVAFPFFCSELQENLIRSHAAGVGKALTPEKTRMLLALRINILSKGYSGIALGTLQQLIDAFNGNSSNDDTYCSTYVARGST